MAEAERLRIAAVELEEYMRGFNERFEEAERNKEAIDRAYRLRVAMRRRLQGSEIGAAGTTLALEWEDWLVKDAERDRQIAELRELVNRLREEHDRLKASVNLIIHATTPADGRDSMTRAEMLEEARRLALESRIDDEEIRRFNEVFDEAERNKEAIARAYRLRAARRRREAGLGF